MSDFPPNTLTSVANVIPSYVYVQYNDDDNIQALFTAYNQLMQSYITTFNTLNLPVYTGPSVSGTLLDWVAQGIYGLTRPSLPSGFVGQVGAFDTFGFNTLTFNGFEAAGNTTYYATNDDDFRRIITWSFYKGDGTAFNINWLKRRVMRFLFGINGGDYPIDNTYRVSVSFGGDRQVNITVTKVHDTVVTSSAFGSFGFNTTLFDEIVVSSVNLPSLAEAPILQAAINTGVLPLPFQYTYVVNV